MVLVVTNKYTTRHAACRIILTLFYIYVYILQQVLSEFAPDSHSVIKPARVQVTRVLHYVSNKFEVSMAFQFLVNFRHGTDRRTACNTLSP